MFKDWALFFLMIALSSTLGSVCHGIHDQLGVTMMNVIWFLMNAVSLISIYFFYRAAYLYFNLNKPPKTKTYHYFVIAWIIISLIITFFQNNFILIKINAGIILLYSLIVHSLTFKNKQAGSLYTIIGIIISFLSIIVHSLKLSLSEWFNYKDISHVIMLIALAQLFKGVKMRMPENIRMEG